MFSNSLPADFITRMQRLAGSEFALLEAALQAEAPVSIRVNRGKGVCGMESGEPVAWCDTGYYLPERLPFTFDPLFHAGAYYVQEASSMFLEQVVRRYVTAPVVCLDLCAAPGGKAAHLAGLLPEGSLLVCNETVRSRSHILAENMTKWGNPNVIVANNSPEEIGELTGLFDVVLADVPCSGEGMFRKDPDSIAQWSIANVNLCAARQRRIVRDVWDALKPGGLLVYSTCAYNTEENEDNVHYIAEELGAEALPVPAGEAWGITPALKYANPACRFFPHRSQGEGFFLALLRKREGTVGRARFKGNGKREKEKENKEAAAWLSRPADFLVETRKETVHAIPCAHAETYRLLSAANLHILSAGIRLCEVKGKDLIPCPALALSTSLTPAAFPVAELTWEEAVRYLKRETLLLPSGTEKGYVIVAFNGFPLGFVKNLGNRGNNLYPQEWRIRTSHIPAERRVQLKWRQGGGAECGVS
ncbi:Ribosomal RNA small subunit methyltransferase F [Bacteroidales bacterium Barb7]|nr:Ribosomal RNA small subunit methyltransferase F [Bacteroidales bacterium Barb7]